MVDEIRRALASLHDAISWLPEPAIGIGMLALAVALALAVHKGVSGLFRRLLRHHAPFAISLLASAGDVTRYALVILALSLTLPAVPLTAEVTEIVGKLLLLATIAMFGWIALVAVNLGADLYLLRFRIDTEDNLLARKLVTQVRILERAAETMVVLVTAGFALMTFESVRQYGVSLFASAGVAGIVAGFAARPLLSSLIAGVQIAMTQPIRIDDAVVVEGEWGWIEEITATYVVIKLWDWRRLIVPLSYFMEKPFQNWTRESASIIGSVFLYLDYQVPVERVRGELKEIAEHSRLWDGRVVNLQVSDAKADTIELRALVSARSSPDAWDLRCEVREKLIDFLQREYPQALPRQRAEVEWRGEQGENSGPVRLNAGSRILEMSGAQNRSRG